MITEPADVYLYFNFRSPYCYLASKTIWRIFDDYRTNLIWRPLGGWDGRSPPEVAVKRLPIARQDMARFARRLGIPVNPPPKNTDPTLAGAGSLLAEEKGLLRPYIVEVMRKEWAEGKDIGVLEVLLDVGSEIGLDRDELADAAQDPVRQAALAQNWSEAEERGAVGVPTFICEDQIFWGQDRIEFVMEYLQERRLSRI
ncbi:MAG: disulfide bond formation protein DsbA [gamma proteobacterium symbiont of Ctena orbiculata]|nr:MAG: disulfide bond formation protein DsbA [gamma proteobacterium symbiont of Ctena orbiculata]PVV24433.1 MAG: disulfide bond formation protein DsbA [gamma proteobacterium symbiont of Ctena orbiculata]PVV27770.1 MAG: disulfide bond formation protein DsbA [gamma proteobacterium symbiont of Ctena orbiculata]